MKRFSEQFNTKATTVRLSAAEKRALRERVVSYMEYHPISASPVVTPYVEVSPFAFFQSTAWKKFQYGGVAALAVIFVVSVVAEKSVPGDALYAVKQVNEEVRGSLTLNSYEKVVWETERLNRRMAEARILASEGRLTGEIEAEVAKAVKVHTDNARKEIEVLKQTDQDEATLAAIELTTALEVQSSSIKNDNDFTADAEIGFIKGIVLDAAKAVGQVTGERNLPSYDKLMAKTERETSRAYELLANIKKNATKEEQSDILRRLEDVERKVSVAIGLKDQEEIKAREELVLVLEQTHKLIIFMTNIDVRATLTVEEIVPVTLTTEERQAEVKRKLAETITLSSLVKEALATSTSAIDSEVEQKALLALEIASSSVSQVSNYLAGESVDIVTVELIMNEGYNVIHDIALMLGVTIKEEPVVEVEEIVPAPPVIELPEEEIVPEEVGTTSSSTVVSEEVSVDLTAEEPAL
jgi:hypothetical protein